MLMLFLAAVFKVYLCLRNKYLRSKQQPHVVVVNDCKLRLLGVEKKASDPPPPVCSAQVRVVQGPGPEVVRPAGGVQHAAGDRRSGVHLLPFQRLVHGHRDRREGLLRQLPLQHAGGSASFFS